MRNGRVRRFLYLLYVPLSSFNWDCMRESVPKPAVTKKSKFINSQLIYLILWRTTSTTNTLNIMGSDKDFAFYTMLTDRDSWHS